MKVYHLSDFESGSRWYLQRARDLAEKTDTGRVTSPSILRLLETSAVQDNGSDTTGRTSAELWDGADKVLEVFFFSFEAVF